jgi:hypothetical protein
MCLEHGYYGCGVDCIMNMHNYWFHRIGEAFGVLGKGNIYRGIDGVESDAVMSLSGLGIYDMS